MIAAAAMITRAVRATPAVTAARASPSRSRSSLMRETRKTS
jgi:hypothetical protein